MNRYPIRLERLVFVERNTSVTSKFPVGLFVVVVGIIVREVLDITSLSYPFSSLNTELSFHMHVH